VVVVVAEGVACEPSRCTIGAVCIGLRKLSVAEWWRPKPETNLSSISIRRGHRMTADDQRQP
jgi:hypothetical protein